jgi:hypothetical protein
MRKFAIAIGTLALLALPACSSDSDGDEPDAGATIDGGATPDAPDETLTGIGQRCTSPAECTDPPAVGCLGAPANYCTFECATNITVMSDAMGNILLSQIPDASHEACFNAYMGSQGASICGILTSVSPAPPIQPNTEYMVSAACAVVCDQQNQCPAGYTCQADGSCL